MNKNKNNHPRKPDQKTDSASQKEKKTKKKTAKSKFFKKPGGKFNFDSGWLKTGRKIALVFFAAVGTYFIIIYLDIILLTFFKKHLYLMSEFVQKYLVTPLALEGSFIIGISLILYLLGRFVDLKIWPTVISIIILVHLLDFSTRFIINQHYLYLSIRPWLLRIPGLLIQLFLGSFILKLALKKTGNYE